MGPSYSRGTAYRNTPAGAMFNTTLSAVKSANGPGSRAAAETAKSAHGLESVYSDRRLCRAAAGGQFMGREIIHIDEIRDLGIVIP
jgi:hypothetical protein